MRILYRGCLLPNVDSFDQVVTEKKSFLEINQSEIRIACGSHAC
jgi:hypothetical protein